MDDERTSFEALTSGEERERHIFCDLELLGQWLSKVEDHPNRRAWPVNYIREVVARYRGPWRVAGAITQPAEAASSSERFYPTTQESTSLCSILMEPTE